MCVFNKSTSNSHVLKQQPPFMSCQEHVVRQWLDPVVALRKAMFQVDSGHVIPGQAPQGVAEGDPKYLLEDRLPEVVRPLLLCDTNRV